MIPGASADDGATGFTPYNSPAVTADVTDAADRARQRLVASSPLSAGDLNDRLAVAGIVVGAESDAMLS